MCVDDYGVNNSQDIMKNVNNTDNSENDDNGTLRRSKRTAATKCKQVLQENADLYF